jgi:hypothetical protein
MKKPTNQTIIFDPQSMGESMSEETYTVANHPPSTLKSGTQYSCLYSDYVSKKKSNQQPKLASVDINIISNNINGLQLQNPDTRLYQLFQRMEEKSIDIFLIQEVNTNILHPVFNKSIQHITSKHHFT